ncbi:MAG: hypothetical protein CV045_13410, partial [Cyanobacteria bacterium M5B4]
MVRYNQAGYGGAIRSEGQLTITGSRFQQNTSYQTGGAIYATGETRIQDSTFLGNRSNGGTGAGAIYASESLLIENSTFDTNRAFSGSAGAVYVTGIGEQRIIDSTFTENSATEHGGGLVLNSNVTLSNTTVSNNTAPQGGGIETRGTSNIITIINATLANNSTTNAAEVSGSALDNSTGATVRLTQSIVDGTITGTLTSRGYNLFTDSSVNGTRDTDLLGSDPLLGELDDNGGDTQTLMPAVNSPAVNAIPVRSCASPLDQRGIARPQGSACDIGAVEVDEALLPTPTPTETPTP